MGISQTTQWECDACGSSSTRSGEYKVIQLSTGQTLVCCGMSDCVTKIGKMIGVATINADVAAIKAAAGL